MIAANPVGTQAGWVDVVTDDDGYTVRGSDSSEYFEDIETATREVYRRTVKLLLDARPDLLWIHAGVVSSAGRAIVLAGPSGNGKSTMVSEFLERGWHYLSDEIAPIHPSSAAVLPFLLSPYKRVSSALYLPQEDMSGLDKVSVEVRQDALIRAPQRIDALYFLSYSHAAATTKITSCPPAAAVIEVLRNSLSLCESRETEIGAICNLVSSTRACYYLHYSDAADAVRKIMLTRRGPEPLVTSEVLP